MIRRRRTKLEGMDIRRRVLGPTQPQLTCEECFTEIDRYVELEAEGVDAAAVLPQMRAHLDGCPACNEEHDELLAFLVSR